MKPWLFDILACPIDKHFPLVLYIFSYDTDDAEFQSFIDAYKERNIERIKKEKIIEISNEGDRILVRDNVIIEKLPIQEYIKTLIVSIEEMEHFRDRSPSDSSKACLELIKTDIKKTVQDFSSHISKSPLETVFPELYFINKMKIETEIKSGILFCKKCKRWFPIVDTIPQMLPDEFREEKKDVQFLKTYKHLLDEDFFSNDLKPFRLE